MEKRRPTINDVAKYASVSRQTVSRYINRTGPVSQKAAERIVNAIEALKFHPSAWGRNLRRKSTRTVGLAVYSATDLSTELSELYALKLSGVLEVLGPRGYALQVVETNPAAAEQGRGTYYLDKVRAGEIDGLIISDFHLSPNDLQYLHSLHLPFVMIDRFSEQFPGRCAIVDQFGEGYVLTKGLLDRGHREIGYCGWPPHRGLARLFLDGIRGAIKDHGNKARLIAEVYPVPGDTSATLDRFSRFLSQPSGPSAVVCNDDWTTGMVALLAERGVPYAPSFQLAGVSLRPHYLDAAHVVLVATPLDRELGIAGAELLVDLIEGKRERTDPVSVGLARFTSPMFPYRIRAYREFLSRRRRIARKATG